MNRKNNWESSSGAPTKYLHYLMIIAALQSLSSEIQFLDQIQVTQQRQLEYLQQKVNLVQNLKDVENFGIKEEQFIKIYGNAPIYTLQQLQNFQLTSKILGGHFLSLFKQINNQNQISNTKCFFISNCQQQNQVRQEHFINYFGTHYLTRENTAEEIRANISQYFKANQNINKILFVVKTFDLIFALLISLPLLQKNQDKNNEVQAKISQQSFYLQKDGEILSFQNQCNNYFVFNENLLIGAGLQDNNLQYQFELKFTENKINGSFNPRNCWRSPDNQTISSQLDCKIQSKLQKFEVISIELFAFKTNQGEYSTQSNLDNLIKDLKFYQAEMCTNCISKLVVSSIEI